MKIVIDASVVISVIMNESHKDRLIHITKDATLLAPSSLHWEIGNAFSAMFKRKKITIHQALKALISYEHIPIQFQKVDLDRSLKLAEKLDIYAYDAYFIECALHTRSPLLSLDEGLLAAAKKVDIKIAGVTK